MWLTLETGVACTCRTHEWPGRAQTAVYPSSVLWCALYQHPLFQGWWTTHAPSPCWCHHPTVENITKVRCVNNAMSGSPAVLAMQGYVRNGKNSCSMRNTRHVSYVRNVRKVNYVWTVRNVSCVRNTRNISCVKNVRNSRYVRNTMHVSYVRNTKNVS